ncbi:MAG: FAD-binding oxidoreductase, partial [Terriglobales bacterium]
MRHLLELDPEARRARVQPGLVLDRLREAAERHGLTFAPDPATHSRCTLGGMIGNNSCGVHSIYGGKTVDNLAALEVLLYDGTRLRLGAGAPAACAGRAGALYAGLRGLVDGCGDEVRQGFPRLPRRVSGYNLDQLLPENGFHLARALVGSEGTCATVLEATLDLRPSPPSRVLVGAGFSDVATAADHVPEVLLRRPIGLEGLDGLLLDYMRRKRLLLRDLELIPAGRGTLLIEFGDWDPGAAAAAADGCAHWLRTQGAAVRVYSAAEAARVWHVRESGLGATAFVPGRPHGWEGWEDAAVAPDRLGHYLREFAQLMAGFGYQAPMYGHFGDGCVHMRIDFD